MSSLADVEQRAEAIVTALMHGDRDLAAELGLADPQPVVLGLILAELAAYLHRDYCNALGADPIAVWQRFMLHRRGLDNG